MEKTNLNKTQNRSKLSKPSRQQYNLSAYSIDREKFSKDVGAKTIANLNCDNPKYLWKKYNIQNVEKKGIIEDFFQSFIISSGFHPNEKMYSKINKEGKFFSDFVFFDFDNKSGNKITFELAHQLLDSSDFNYILTTSQSHLEDGSVHKLHILIPVFSTITSDAEHKQYHQAIYNRIFKNFETDSSMKTISSRMFPGKEATFRIEYKFDKNDFHLNYKPHQKKALRKISKSSNKAKTNGVAQLDLAALNSYGQMINNEFGMMVSNDNSDGEAIRYYRNADDPVPAIYSKINDDGFEQNLIFDKHIKSNGKAREFRTFFAYDDFKKCVDATAIVDEARQKLTQEVDSFLSDKSKLKRYLITNEGLGKSYSTLKLGAKHNFIYCTHTRKKLDEVAVTLRELGLDFVRIYSAEEILLQNKVSSSIVRRYLQWVTTAEDKSISVFFADLLEELRNTNFKAYECHRLLFRKVLNAIRSNAKKVRQNKVVIMTSKKLMTMLGQKHEIDKPVIFDEFTAGEWYRMQPKPAFTHQKPTRQMLRSWGFKVNADLHVYHQFYLHPNFLDLLNKKKVLILSTEKRLLEDILYESDYAPLSDLNFEFKIKSDDVIYLLVKSTKKDHRIKAIDLFKSRGPVFCNAVKGDNVHTHMSIKGLNNLNNQPTTVIGSWKPEIPLKTHLINCIHKYRQLYNQSEYHVAEFSKTMNNPSFSERHKWAKSWDLLYRFSEPLIQNILMEAEVSQSIGRSQGYRARGKKTVVLLPALLSSTTRKTRDIRLNYVSPHVYHFSFNDAQGTPYCDGGPVLQRIRHNNNHSDDLDEHRKLVPWQYKNKFPDKVLRQLSFSELKKKIKALEFNDYVAGL